MSKCSFYLCIYNEKDQCILDEIKISAAGYCDSCIIPNFPEDILQSYKKALLDKFEGIHAKLDNR